MKINFTYNKERDAGCLLSKGRNSNNSQNSTTQYQELIKTYGENPTLEATVVFVEQYIAKNEIDIFSRKKDIQADWESISIQFEKRVESIFNISLPSDITVYLTINSRCPYSIKDNSFYVSMQSNQARKKIMHELWHFYTWYGLGTDQEEKLGKEKYNDFKEALTVLLNIECRDLLPEGVVDVGYPQHQEIRKKILEYWNKDKNIKNLWNYLVN